MMCLIAKAAKGYSSPKFKNKIYSFNKYDIANLKLPEFIEDIADEKLYEIIKQLVAKYKSKEYKRFEREELDDFKDWNDMQILFLLKFYKNGWSFQIPDENEFFPNWTFTYNPAPLKKLIDKIVGHCYDKIEPSSCKWCLKEDKTFSALDVTYLLHYFVITHPEYEED